jgi:hypothetical protein
MLRRMFGRKKEDVIGGCRKKYNEWIYNICSLPTIFRVINEVTDAQGMDQLRECVKCESGRRS